MRRSLCTVALDLAVCPHGPDTRLKLNYRLVAPGPKRGLFGWPLSEKRSFSHSGTGKKNVMGFKEEKAGLEDIFFLLTVSTGAAKTEMSTKTSKSYVVRISGRGPVGIGLGIGKNGGLEEKITDNNHKNEKKMTVSL